MPLVSMEHRRSFERYPSDLCDWALIAPLLPPTRRVGRPRTTDLRNIVDTRPSTRVERLPVADAAEGLPAGLHGSELFYAWRDSASWQGINHLARRTWMAAKPASAGVIDSQSVKATDNGRSLRLW